MLNLKKIFKSTTLLVFVILILIIIASSFKIVPAGFRGIMLNFGAPQDKTLGQGLSFKIPFYQNIVILDVRNIKYEVDVLAYSKDIQSVDSRIALNYHLNPDRVSKLYQEIGKDYQDKVINPAVQESVKAATAKFTAQELIEERPKVKDEIRAELFTRFNDRNIIVDDFSIVNFDFSDAYEKAVEEKQVAQQSALKSENDLKRIKTEAEQRVAQARAEGEAIKFQSDAANNDKYIQLKALEVQLEAVKRWNGVLPTQMIPGGSVPFINVK